MGLAAQQLHEESSPPPEGAGHNPIVAALRQMMVASLGTHLREMFDKADDILFDSAEKARAGDEQRLYMDTMRLVRIQRAKILQTFESTLDSALNGVLDEAQSSSDADVDDMSSWSLSDGDQLEERLAISSMQSKAEASYAQEISELQRRMARLQDVAGANAAQSTFTPARVIRTFQDSVKELNVDFPIKLVLYKLFDRVVLSRFCDVLSSANQLLAVHGVEPVAGQEGRSNRPRSPATVAASAASSSMASPAWANGFDAATMGAFGATGQPGGGVGRWPMAVSPGYGSAMYAPSDDQLAREASGVLHAYAEGRQPQAPAWMPPEAVALIARMFDGYYRDSRLGNDVKPMFSRLQLPMLKAALSDPTFFSDPAHPARRTVNDLFDVLAQFSASGSATAKDLSELDSLVNEIARSFALDPEKLREHSHRPQSDFDADGFLRQQDEQSTQKKRTRVERIRRIVAHEIRKHVGNRHYDAGVMRLLLSGFGPLLSVEYLRGGVDGEGWCKTMELVDRMLRSLDSPAAEHAERASEEASVVSAITRRLSAIGFGEDRLSEVLSGLLAAYLKLGERAPAAAAFDLSIEAPPTATLDVAPATLAPASVALTPEQELQGLMAILLVPGAWFTILDTEQQIKHWVRVKSHHAAQSSVLFAHYMEEKFITMRSSSFASGVAHGTVSPIDPTTELASAVQRLVEIAGEPNHEPIIWKSADGKALSAG